MNDIERQVHAEHAAMANEGRAIGAADAAFAAAEVNAGRENFEAAMEADDERERRVRDDASPLLRDGVEDIPEYVREAAAASDDGSPDFDVRRAEREILAGGGGALAFEVRQGERDFGRDL